MHSIATAPPAPTAPCWRIVAADHPSLGHDVHTFVDDLRSESRFFGPTARTNPKPFPSLIDSLTARGGFRLAATDGEAIIGLVRVDDDGQLTIAVRADRRGCGLGTELGRAALRRAIELGYGRVVLRSTRRSRAAHRIGEALGCTVVQLDRGRTDLILELAPTSDIA